ncbi:hypothetical protein TSOC_006743 [Tetrabaena socialis]|uniref:Uncharacterized protein n=1 Tax=Tetrabaena socialis TaxID=47790 RepID=A0A2J8A2U5_9CHLO|nr:hypothetical protein TSOC_006743 [Tetrabaena socialis]|eukprot:PNH06836.1 hypothetical protein TSOC_006743 [Tetrabaena socialis]
MTTMTPELWRGPIESMTGRIDNCCTPRDRHDTTASRHDGPVVVRRVADLLARFAPAVGRSWDDSQPLLPLLPASTPHSQLLPASCGAISPAAVAAVPGLGRAVRPRYFSLPQGMPCGGGLQEPAQAPLVVQLGFLSDHHPRDLNPDTLAHTRTRLRSAPTSTAGADERLAAHTLAANWGRSTAADTCGGDESPASACAYDPSMFHFPRPEAVTAPLCALQSWARGAMWAAQPSAERCAAEGQGQAQQQWPCAQQALGEAISVAPVAAATELSVVVVRLDQLDLGGCSSPPIAGWGRTRQGWGALLREAAQWPCLEEDEDEGEGRLGADGLWCGPADDFEPWGRAASEEEDAGMLLSPVLSGEQVTQALCLQQPPAPAAWVEESVTGDGETTATWAEGPFMYGISFQDEQRA